MSEILDPSPAERLRRPWVDWSYRGTVLGMVSLAAGLAWQDNARGVRIEEIMDFHLEFHPDLLLAARIDRLQDETDGLDDRLRGVQITLGDCQAPEE